MSRHTHLLGALPLLLLLSHATRTRADFDRDQIQDRFRFRIGDTSCPDIINFLDDELHIEADEVTLNEQACTGGPLQLRRNPTEGHGLTVHLSSRPASDIVGSFVGGDLDRRLECGDAAFGAGTFFNLFNPRRDLTVTWRDVVGSGTPIEDATGPTFTFKQDTAYIVVNSRCIYTPGELRPVNVDDDDAACFPASALVAVPDGPPRRMRTLRTGDAVLAAPGKRTTILGWTHRAPDASPVAGYVRLSTTGGALVSTRGHFVYANGSAVPAASVRVGDVMPRADGSFVTVLKVSRVWGRGLYNPQTLHGDIVVDGFVVSTYTTAVEPVVAHALLAPVRAAARALSAIGVVSVQG